VATGGAEGVTQLDATLTATLDEEELPGTIAFEFGTSPATGNLIPGVLSADGASFTASFAGYLLPATTYYYRALATNTDGTSYGAERSFTTSAYPAVISQPPTPQLLAFAPTTQPPKEHGTVTPRHTTRAQKLTSALRRCKRAPKNTRAACKRRARKVYGKH
jgi:hypothetical protein